MIKSGYSSNLINESANPKADLKSKINQIAVSLNKNGKDGPSRYNQYNLRELALAIIQYRNNYDSKAFQMYIDMINRKAESWSTPTYDEYRTQYANKLVESTNMNESAYDGDTVNWNKLSVGDVVGWTIEGMGKLPRVGDSFRVGPFIGKCTKVSGSKVYMKIESNSREMNEAINTYINKEDKITLSKLKSQIDTYPVGTYLRYATKGDINAMSSYTYGLLKTDNDKWSVYSSFYGAGDTSYSTKELLNKISSLGAKNIGVKYPKDKSMNESVYYVSGSTPTGEGDADSTNSGKITDPAKAIEQWFKIGAKHRTGTAITATKKSDAIALVTWADKNQDKITEWHKKYGCPYKLDFLLKAISDQVRRKCSSFYEGEYGDMVYPFDVG